jgi:hypothetical protein
MHLFAVLPSLEDRKRKLDSLKALFEGFGEKIPIIINLDETTNDADAENVTAQSRLAMIFLFWCIFKVHFIDCYCVVHFKLQYIVRFFRLSTQLFHCGPLFESL